MKAMGPWSDGSQKICRSQKEQSPKYLNPGSEEINDQLKLGMMQGKIKKPQHSLGYCFSTLCSE